MLASDVFVVFYGLFIYAKSDPHRQQTILSTKETQTPQQTGIKQTSTEM